MIDELSLVALTSDIPDHHLHKGDVGTVVHLYSDGQAYEVEFSSADGMTVAVLTLPEEAIRRLGGHEILHVRDLAPATV
jgi:hypothetical protein